MGEFVKVARVEDVPENGRLWHEFDEETVVIFRVNGEFFCIADLCTHDDGPLEDGELAGYEVACPRHGARFDIRTGEALCLPAATAVPRYQVKVEEGAIWVESPE